MINQASLDLIKRSEGFVDHWYPDPASGGQPYTCCYGHTSLVGPPLYSPGQHFTAAEGEQILKIDLAKIEPVVRQHVTVVLNENQFGALVSFVYNLGSGNFINSTLLKKLNAGDYQGAADQFGQWTLAAGKHMPGLVIRRAAERTLFLTPAGVSLPIPTPPAPKPPAASMTIWERIIAIFSNLKRT